MKTKIITFAIVLSLLAACKQGAQDIQTAIENASVPEELDLTGVPPNRMLLTPGDQNLSAGEIIQLRATGVYTKDYSQVIKSGVIWTSDKPEVFQVDSNGTGKGLIEGRVLVTASYLGVRSSIQITVDPPTTSQLLIFPEKVTLELPLKKGKIQPQDFQLKAYALKSDGQVVDITEEADWQIDDSSGLKALPDQPGLYSAQAVGDWQVKIELASLEATKTIQVSQQVKLLKSIRPSVNPLVLRVGQTLSLATLGLYSDESESILAEDWSLSPSSDLFSISAKQVTGLRSGSVNLTLHSNQLQAPISIYVQEPELTSISVVPSTFILRLGESASFIVNANYGDGTTAEITSAVTSNSTNTSVMTLTGANRFQGNVQGSANLLVAYRGLSAAALVAVDSPVISRLEIRPPSLRVVTGRSITFQVWGIYTNGSEAELTSLASSQSLSTARAEVPQGTTGQLLGKANGLTVLSATYVDPISGRNVSGSASVTVDPPELESLSFDIPSTSIAQGRSFDFAVRGLYSDTTQIDVGSQVQITADVSSAGMSYVGSIIRTTNNRIRVQSVAQGTMRIIASLGGRTASAQVTVTEKVLDSVQIVRQPTFTNPAFLLKGSSTDFIARAIFSDNSTVDVTTSVGIYTVSWTPPNPALATFTDVDGKKRLTGIADGDAPFNVTVQSPQGNGSASFAMGIYIPCSGTGQYSSYQCWFLGTAGSSCDSTCSAVGRIHHSATITSVGSGAGSNNECSNILNGLFRSSLNYFNSAATAAQGVGCSIYAFSGLNLGLREVAIPTTSSASLADFRRVCSCEPP